MINEATNFDLEESKGHLYKYYLIQNPFLMNQKPRLREVK